MLAALERENVNNFLEINTFLTGALSPDEVRDGISKKTKGGEGRGEERRGEEEWSSCYFGLTQRSYVWNRRGECRSDHGSHVSHSLRTTQVARRLHGTS